MRITEMVGFLGSISRGTRWCTDWKSLEITCSGEHKSCKRISSRPSTAINMTGRRFTTRFVQFQQRLASWRTLTTVKFKWKWQSWYLATTVRIFTGWICSIKVLLELRRLTLASWIIPVYRSRMMFTQSPSERHWWLESRTCSTLASQSSWQNLTHSINSATITRHVASKISSSLWSEGITGLCLGSISQRCIASTSSIRNSPPRLA